MCNFVKIFETIMHTLIYNSIKFYLSPFQHGFMEHRSVVSNLASFTQFCSKVLDTQGQIGIIYTDIQKVYDQINHYILLSKLDQSV